MEFLYQVISGIGLLGFAVWNVYLQFRSTNNSIAKQIREDDEKRIKQLEEILDRERKESRETITGWQKIVEDYKTEVTKLQTSNSELNKANGQLRELLQDKNPEMLTVISELKTLQIEIVAFLKDNLLSMNNQTAILELLKQKNLDIEEASKAHTGDLTRVP